jgi:hypothetical protein
VAHIRHATNRISTIAILLIDTSMYLPYRIAPSSITDCEMFTGPN